MKRMHTALLTALFGLVFFGVSVWALKSYVLPGDIPRIGLDIRKISYSTIRDVNYCNPGGEPQRLDLYTLDGNAGNKYPVVIYLHGGSWSGGDKSSGEVLQYLPQLSKAGYIVASVNYRLLPQHRFPAPVEDAKCAVRFLRANADKYNIDPGNIGVIGDSAGGYLAAFVGVSGNDASYKSREYGNQSDEVQAVIDLFGPADFTIGGGSSNIATARQFIGNASTAEASPISYVTRDDAPFLIIHGDIDKTVPLAQSSGLHQKLKSVNVPSELVVVKNAGHELPKDGQGVMPSPYDIATKILSFLNMNLKDS